jgi:hypothetical protein
MQRTIADTEDAVRSVAMLIEPARASIQAEGGVGLKNRATWVLRDSAKAVERVGTLNVSHQSLGVVINALQTKGGVGSNAAAQDSQDRIEDGRGNGGIPSYELSEFLAWQRRKGSRMKTKVTSKPLPEGTYENNMESQPSIRSNAQQGSEDPPHSSISGGTSQNTPPNSDSMLLNPLSLANHGSLSTAITASAAEPTISAAELPHPSFPPNLPPPPIWDLDTWKIPFTDACETQLTDPAASSSPNPSVTSRHRRLETKVSILGIYSDGSPSTSSLPSALIPAQNKPQRTPEDKLPSILIPAQDKSRKSPDEILPCTPLHLQDMSQRTPDEKDKASSTTATPTTSSPTETEDRDDTATTTATAIATAVSVTSGSPKSIRIRHSWLAQQASRTSIGSVDLDTTSTTSTEARNSICSVELDTNTSPTTLRKDGDVDMTVMKSDIGMGSPNPRRKTVRTRHSWLEHQASKSNLELRDSRGSW